MSEADWETKGRHSERRIDEIEVLRAVAILMVVVDHIPFNLFFWHSGLQDVMLDYWSGGTGVDLFFTISGFVIARSLLPRLQAAHGALYLVETLTFFVRRFWRLQPSAWLWLAVPLVLCLVFNRTNAFHDFHSNLASAVTALMVINNFRFGELFGVGDTSIVVQYWSLSLEEQFYLLLPAVVFFLRRRTALLMVALLIYQFLMPQGAVYNCTRPGAIAVGVLLAIWSRHPAYRLAAPAFLGASRLLRVAFMAVSILLLGALGSALPAPVGTLTSGIVAVLSGVLVYVASLSRGYVMQPGRIRASLVWLGSRSYAVYLTHLVAFALTHELYVRLHPPILVISTAMVVQFLVIGLGLTLGLAELNYRLVETPGRIYGRGVHLRLPEAVLQ